MSLTVSIAGQSFTVPQTGDGNWSDNVTNLLVKLATSTAVLQTSSSSFPLTTEVDFGSSYGLKSAYFKSRATNPSASGQLRLGNTESLSWRNAGNTSDLALSVNASDVLQYNGSNILSAGAASIVNADVSPSAAIAYSKLNLSGSVVNADVSASAAIAYSKLNLASSIVNADISASAAIAYSKLSLASSIVNADVSASAAIAYSKLSLATSIVNADISASAAITLSKLAALTTGKVLQSNASTGAIEASSITNTQLGYLSTLSSDIQVQADAKVAKSTYSAKGSILAASAASTPANLSVGTDGQVLVADSSQSSGVKWATANSGSKNYFAYSSFENNSTSGFSLFNTTLTSSIPTGSITAGASSITTFNTTSSGALAGSYSLQTAIASGTITAGQGFISDNLTLDAEDKAKVMQVSFSYSATTGSSLMNFSGTSSNTWAVYIYDNANSSWIQPAGVYNLVQGSGAGKLTATFQTPSNATTVRLAVICINANTSGAVTMLWDTFFLGPQVASSGFQVAGLFGRTGSLSFSGGTSADMIYNQGLKDTHGSYSTSTGIYTVPVSGYYQISATAYIQGTVTANSELHITDTSNNNIGRLATIYGSTVANQTGQIGGTLGKYFNAGDQFKIRVYVGAGSSLQVYGDNETTLLSIVGPTAIPSSDTDTRVVAASYHISADLSVSANTAINFDVKDYDTHNAVTLGAGTWKFTVPVSGIYRVSFIGRTSGATGTTYLSKNGSNYGYLQLNAVETRSASTTVQCVAGDTLSIATDTTATYNFFTPRNTSVSIERLSGPATIAPTETVAASYSISSNYSVSANNPVNFDTKIDDSHGAVTTGASWKFTAPVSGRYQILVSSAITTGSCNLYLYKNGSSQYALISMTTGVQGSGGMIRLNAGDYISAVSDQAKIYVASTNSTIHIVRIGN